MLHFRPVWFDSLGAKSSCVWVKTNDISLVIDPGIAIMQPSFPASWTKKIYWLEQGKREIKKACKSCDAIIISHYHYDHYFPDDFEIYRNKTVFLKNPNEYINDSQRKRAEEFFQEMCNEFGIEFTTFNPPQKNYEDPILSLKFAGKKKFGNYTKRRQELLAKGEKWFQERVKKWKTWKWISEINAPQIKTIYAEKMDFKFGKTEIRFTPPFFHGVEFSRVGWIFATVIEHGKKKLIHSSDMNGPVIEDYATWIVQENPDILILDGPPTYLIPYMMNMINLKRCIQNISKIIKETDTETIILDHHLLREKNYRKKLNDVYILAKRERKSLFTAAEFLGKEAVIDKL